MNNTAIKQGILYISYAFFRTKNKISIYKKASTNKSNNNVVYTIDKNTFKKHLKSNYKLFV